MIYHNFFVQVNPVSEVEFQVVDGGKKFLVKLNCSSCSCLFWDLEEIPRTHALIVIRSLNLDLYALFHNIIMLVYCLQLIVD